MLGALAGALAALVVVAVIAWRDVRSVTELSARRAALSAYADSVTALRLQAQNIPLQSRDLGSTGGPGARDSAIAAERAAIIAQMDRAHRDLQIWLPLVAGLALVMGALALLLLRIQARARAQDLTRFRAIFDNTFQFIGLLSRDGTLLEANRTALEFGGLEARDVIGRPFWEARWWTASPETQAQLRDAVARAARGEFVRYPVEVLGAGGRRVTIDFSLKPALDPDGNVALLVPEGRDITEQRASEAAARVLQEQLAALLRFSPSLIAVLDADGRYLQVSDSIAAVIGRPVPEIVGRRLDDLLPAATVATFRRRLEQVRSTGRAIDVEDTVGAPGEERRYRTVLFPLRDARGAVFAIGTVAINITEAHEARLRLEAALDENRVLQGLLSICAQCKRIRDADDQQWKPVEAYVQDHTAATFSHGLCPSCAAAFLRDSGFDDGP